MRIVVIIAAFIGLHAAAQTMTPGVCGSDDGVAPLPIDATPEAKAFRETAAGLELGDFTTRDGRTFRDVVVRSADDIRLIFRHRDGTAKLDYPNLPSDLQLRFVGHEVPPPEPVPVMPADVQRRFRILRQEAWVRRHERDKRFLEKDIEGNQRAFGERMKVLALGREKTQARLTELDAELEDLKRRRKSSAEQPTPSDRSADAALDRQIRNREIQREAIAGKLEALSRVLADHAERKSKWDQERPDLERRLAALEAKLDESRAKLDRLKIESEKLGDDPEAYAKFRKEHPQAQDPSQIIVE